MGLVVIAVGALLFAPTSAATTFTVSANPYSANGTLSPSNPYDAHELTAATGQNVAYTMTVTTSGGCAELFYVKGHNVNPNSQYYQAYSTSGCVASFSKTFPVASADGTAFTVMVASTASTAVAYSVTITVTTPALPTWIVPLLALVIIVVVVVVFVVVVVRRRRKSATPPPMAPPPAGPPRTP